MIIYTYSTTDFVDFTDLTDEFENETSILYQKYPILILQNSPDKIEIYYETELTAEEKTRLDEIMQSVTQNIIDLS